MCGFCERYGCEHKAKASPQATVLPALLKSDRFELRTQAQVLRVELDKDGKQIMAAPRAVRLQDLPDHPQLRRSRSGPPRRLQATSSMSSSGSARRTSVRAWRSHGSC